MTVLEDGTFGKEKNKQTNIYVKLDHFAKQAEINSIINQLNLSLKNKITTKKIHTCKKDKNF